MSLLDHGHRSDVSHHDPTEGDLAEVAFINFHAHGCRGQVEVRREPAFETQPIILCLILNIMESTARDARSDHLTLQPGRLHFPQVETVAEVPFGGPG